MNKEHIKMVESAVKAAGIAVEGWTIDRTKGMRLVDDPHNFVEYWNPLEDDAQCLQLARKLGITIDYVDNCAYKRAHNVMLQEYFDQQGCEGWWKTDREAVVAVASQLGEKL